MDLTNMVQCAFKVQTCLPGDYDRFKIQTIPTSCRGVDINDKTWVILRNSAKPGPAEPPRVIGELDSEDNTHPEGSIAHSSGLVVSNVPVTESLEELGNSILEKAGFEICGSKPRATVFLMPDEKGPRVQYYITDHSARTVLWAGGDDVPNPIAAMEHSRARNILREEYWVHMENFPAPVPATMKDLEELKAVLGSLAIDAATSDGSTSPFTPGQIQEFLAILNTFKGNLGTLQTYAIARLWCMIWHARVVNNYGTPQACLDRFTILSEQPPAFTGPYANYTKYFIGADANAHLERCSRAWAGRIAYVSEWRNFKAKNELEWSQIMWLACVLIIASILSRTQSRTRTIPTIALSLGCASLAHSYCLLTESQSQGIQAADASAHFQNWETARYGIQALALRNAAPRALLVWGFLTFILSIF